MRTLHERDVGRRELGKSFRFVAVMISAAAGCADDPPPTGAADVTLDDVEAGDVASASDDRGKGSDVQNTGDLPSDRGTPDAGNVPDVRDAGSSGDLGAGALSVYCTGAPRVLPPCDSGSAQVPDGDGGIVCLTVGPVPHVMRMWPTDVDAAVYVVPGDGGVHSGTMADPYTDLDAVLRQSGDSRDIAIASGTYRLNQLVLTRGRRIVGVGPATGGVRLTVTGPDGGVPITIDDVQVELRGLRLVGNARFGLEVRGSGGRLMLHDVAIDGPGLVVQPGARLNATRVSVDRNFSPNDLTGIVYVTQGHLTWDRGRISGSGGALPAISARGSCVSVSGSLIEHSGGIFLDGSGASVARCSQPDAGYGLCDRDGGVSVGNVAELSQIEVTDSSYVGLNIVGANQRVVATSIHVTDTAMYTNPEGRSLGAGVQVRDGAILTVDLGSCSNESCAGSQSIFQGNDGTGILVTGTACADVAGVSMASNGAAGAFVQNGANAYFDSSCITENKGYGIGLWDPGIVLIRCNGIFATLAGTAISAFAPVPLIFPAGSSTAMADGIALYSRRSTPQVSIVGNHVINNGRFGILAQGPIGIDAAADLIAMNVGADNGYSGANLFAVRDGGVIPDGGSRAQQIPGNDIGGRRRYPVDASLPSSIAGPIDDQDPIF